MAYTEAISQVEGNAENISLNLFIQNIRSENN